VHEVNCIIIKKRNSIPRGSAESSMGNIDPKGLLKLKLIYDRQSVGQSVLVSGAHLGPATNFPFSLKFPSDICGFIILWRPL
jgi:hypothetical protein